MLVSVRLKTLVRVTGIEPVLQHSKCHRLPNAIYPVNYKHNVWAAGFEPAIYQFQTEDVGQATLRPDIVLISKLVRVTGIEPVLQRSGRHRLPNAIYPVKRTKK